MLTHSIITIFLKRSTAALLTAAVAAAIIAPPAAAANTDTLPPEVTTPSTTPAQIDVVDGPAKVTVRFDAADSGSGVNIDTILVYTESEAVPPQKPTLVSGDQLSGTYETVFTIPEYVTAGYWNFYVYMSDIAGNDYIGNGNGWIGGIDVISVDDKEAPTITSSLSSTLVDITDKPAEVRAEVTARDPGVGIAPDKQIMSMTYLGSSGSGTLIKNSSSDLHTAIFTDLHIFGTDSTPGRYRVQFGSISDRNGNSAAGQIHVGEVTVATRPGRGKRPSLANQDGLLIAKWTPTSDLLGVLEYEAQFSGQNETRSIRTTDTAASIADLPAGTYTARVRAKNQLGWGEWSSVSDPANVTTVPVTAAPVVFNDQDGTAKDTYTVPAVKGIEYQVGGKTVAAGTYPGVDTVTVTARALAGYVLASGSPAKWSATFSKSHAGYTPPKKSPFADVSTGQQFYKEMAWLADRGISTGWLEANGTRTYRPMQPINRDAMAAFLYRAVG